MRFEKLHIDHADVVKDAVFSCERVSCQLSFSSLFCYARKYDTEISVSKTDCEVYIRQRRPDFGVCYFCPVVPDAALAAALNNLREHHQKHESTAFTVWGVTDEILDKFCDAAGIQPPSATPDRNWAEYIHTRENLIDMKGKRFHAKKNAVNQFLRANSDFEYAAIDAGNIEEVAEFQKRLMAGVLKFEPNENKAATLIEENLAIERGLGEFARLGLEGGIIRIDGELAAYAFGGAINRNSFDLTFEKALRNYNGIFQVLEQEMLKNNLSGYEFINREEDVGDPGIRFAKERLRPDRLLMKHHFTFGNSSD